MYCVLFIFNSSQDININYFKKKMLEKLLVYSVLLLSPFILLSQNVGDFRSNVTTGNWETFSSWQYYNGFSWVTPSGTSPQGYPGQYTGTGRVTILDNQTITISSSTPNNFSALVIGENVSGSLIVDADIDVKTSSVTINASALVKFAGNYQIRFPENTNVKINSPGKFDDGGVCNSNVAVYIGTVKFAVCKGAGNSELTFDQINKGGGTILSDPAAILPICQSGIVNLVGSYSGTAGMTTSSGTVAGINYFWSVKAPDNTITAFDTQNPNFVASQSGIYLATLNCSTYYGGDLFSNSKTISVLVNIQPNISTQPTNQLDCEGRDINFKVVATGSGLTYSWQYKKLGDLNFTSISSSTTNVGNFDTNIITIRNVGSAQFPNGTQLQVVISNGTCTVTSSTASLLVNEMISISPTTTNVTRCYGATYSYTVSTSYPANVVSYLWKKSINSGVWIVVNDGGAYSGATTSSLKITAGTPSESAEYRVYITFNNTTTQCSVDSATRTRLITFLPLLTAPQITVLQPDCMINTGTIAVSVQSASDSYSFDNGVTYQTTNTKSELVPGTYKVLIKNTGNCLSPVANCTIVAAPPSIWNGTSWTNGPPSSAQALIFNGNFSSIGDMHACSCQVNSGVVQINSGHSLKITNGVSVSGGSLTFEDKASLAQINNAINIGNIIYKRITPAILNTDYVYWSSPVSGYTLGALSPNTLSGKMYSYDAFANPEDWKLESYGTVMAPGKGYIIRGPEYAPPFPPFPSQFPASFTGVPNNGLITVPIGPIGSSNLIGNPYPSALDADVFLAANNTVLAGTIYFWTHNTAIQLATNITGGSAGSGTYAYTSDDYASYNFTGGVGVIGAGTAAATVGFDPPSIPTGKIGSGQSFFTISIVDGKNATFSNSMRLGSGGVKLDNSQFFKNTMNSKSGELIQKNRVWLNLLNGKGAFKQTLVGYISGATNGFDNGYDGESLDGNEFIDFYSVYNDKNLVIQGRALPFERNDSVPLGYRSAISGDFTISVDQVDGLFIDKAIYLKDNLTNSIHNLNESGYNFKTSAGTFNDRFVLGYTNEMLLMDQFDILGNGVLISNKNKEVKISSSVENIYSVLIYDLLGRQIYKKTNVNSRELIVINTFSANQILFLKVDLQGGKMINARIIN